MTEYIEKKGIGEQSGPFHDRTRRAAPKQQTAALSSETPRTKVSMNSASELAGRDTTHLKSLGVIENLEEEE